MVRAFALNINNARTVLHNRRQRWRGGDGGRIPAGRQTDDRSQTFQAVACRLWRDDERTADEQSHSTIARQR